MAQKTLKLKSYSSEKLPLLLKNVDEGSVYMYADTVGNRTYQCFFSVGPEEERDTRCKAWLAARDAGEITEEVSRYLLGRFRIEDPYKVSLALSTADQNYIRSGKTGNYIDFTFKVLDSNNTETHEGVTVDYLFSNGGSTQTERKIYNDGAEVHFLIDDYLSVGTNTVTITVTSRVSEQSTIHVLHYYVVQMDLSTSFNVAVPQSTSSDSLTVPYALTCSSTNTKYVEFYIDGTLKETYPVTETSVDSSMQLAMPASGKHHLQIRAYVEAGDGKFYSKTLYREFVVSGVSGYAIMMSLDLDPGTLIDASKTNLFVTAEQYVQSNITWGYYNSAGASGKVVWTLGGTSIRSTEAQVTDAESNAKPYTLSFVPENYGTLELKATVNGSETAYTIIVNVNSSGVQEASSGLVYRFKAVGRGNDESSDERCVWKSGDIKVNFPAGFPFSSRVGWNTDDDNNTAMALADGWQLSVDDAGFSRTPHINGFFFEIDMMTYDVDNSDAVVVSMWGRNTQGNECGFKITAEGILFQSGDNVQMITKFRQNERHTYGFCINRVSSATMPHLALIFVDGNFERCVDYGEGGSYTNSARLIMGDSTGMAGIKIYSFALFQEALTIKQFQYDYWINRGIIAKKLISNNIYTDGRIDPELVQGQMPVLLFEGLDDAYNNITTLENSTSKTVKVRCNIYYFDPQDPTRNFTIYNAIVWLQGTSSLGYPRKNFKIRFYKKNDAIVMYDFEGNVIAKGMWSVVNGDVPVNEVTCKADFMDSSCTRNATVARLFGDIDQNVDLKDDDGNPAMLTIPQIVAKNYESTTGRAFPYSLRTTPNAFAMMCFHKLPSDKQYTCLGQYTMLNDKGNEYLYGFHSIYAPTSSCPSDIKEEIFADPMAMYMKDSRKEELLTKNYMYRLFDNKDVHCYEILDNTSEFANFSVIEDWDSLVTVEGETYRRLKIETAFESRYPEIDDDDYDNENERTEDAKATFQPLVDFITWLMGYKTDGGELDDTFTKDTAKVHLDLYKCAGHKVYYDRFGAVDQIKKNMMWTTYDGAHWFTIKYDNDSTLDKKNSGALFYDYDFDRNTVDPDSSTGEYCYAGHDSLLWNGLESRDWFMDMYRETDDAYYTAGLTKANLLYYADTLARDKWNESEYNENMDYKYIQPAVRTVNRQDWLNFLQGTDKTHFHWWVYNRFDKYDGENGTGEFTNKSVRVLAGGTPEGAYIYMTAAKKANFGWGINKVARPVDDEGNYSIAAISGESFSVKITKTGGLAIGDPVYIFGANNLSKLDLHELAPYLSSTINLASIYDSENTTPLKILIIGCDLDSDSTLQNNATDIGFSGFDTLTRLEYLDVRGLTGVKSLPFLTSLGSLKTLLAKKTGLTSFTCAEGISFTRLQLPDTLISMTLTRVNWQTLDYTPSATLKYLNLGYMSDETDFMNVKAFIFQWLDVLEAKYGMDARWTDYTLILTGVDWTNAPYHRLEQLMNLGSCQMTGHSYIKCSSEYSSSQMSTLMARFGTTVFTDGSDLVLDCSSGNIILSATGDGVSVRSDGTICILQGYTATMHCTGFPIRGGAEADYQWMQGSSADSLDIVDEDGTLQFDNNTISSEGVITTLECTTPDRTYYIRVRNVNSLAQSVVTPVYIYQRAYPESVELVETGNKWDGEAGGYHQITSRGHAKVDTAFTPSAFDGNIESVTWSLLQNDGETSYTDTTYVQKCVDDYLDGKTDFTEFCLNVKSMPSDDIQLALRYAAVMVNGSEVESPLFRIAIISVIAQALLNIDEGNVPLFGRLDSLGVEHANANWYSSLELRAITNVLDLSGLTDLTSFNGDGNKVTNVLVHLKNCLGLNLSGCTALLQADCYNMQQMRSIDATGTSPMLEVRLPSSGSITIAASANGSGTQPSVFVTDADAYRESIDGQSDECIEPVSDWGRTALMWDDGTRIRFDDDSTALLD